jgi:hypothetical protein
VLPESASSLKPKKKRGWGTKLFAALIVLGLLVVITSAVMKSNPSASSSTSSSQIYSVTTPVLSADDFSIVPTIYICGYHTDGLRFVSQNARMQNDKNIAFHYLSAKIIFANYTLANGTVVQVNQQWTDNSQTFDTTHAFSLPADSNVQQSGPKIIGVEFVVIAYVQEVSQPIIRTVTTPPNC